MIRVSLRTELPQWLVLAAMALAAVAFVPALPERVPTRWDFAGRVVSEGPRETLYLLPLLAIALYVLLLVLPRIDPGRANYAAFAESYTLIRFTILIFLSGAFLLLLLAAAGTPIDVTLVLPLGIGLLFLVLGNVTGKIRPNWFVGIRTPWTLSSKRAWTRTHRLGGWVFVASGLAFVLAAAARAPWAFAAALAIAIGGTAYLVVYSYLVWRSDPDKLPPSGTLPAE